MARKYNWRRVKKHFSYDVVQAAKAVNCSVATIRNWTKQGLPVMADQKPFLIDGHDLQAFARQKSDAQKGEKPKTNAPWNYFACFRCKGFRKPYLLLVDYTASSPDKGRLSSICEVCDCNIVKFCKADQLPKISATLFVTHQSGPTTLFDPETP